MPTSFSKKHRALHIFHITGFPFVINLSLSTTLSDAYKGKTKTSSLRPRDKALNSRFIDFPKRPLLCDDTDQGVGLFCNHNNKVVPI